MRAFFHPANPGYPASHSNINIKTGLPLQCAGSIRQLRTQISASSPNVGNLIHNEAIAKTFQFDMALSAMGGIEGLYRSECNSKPKDFQQKLSSNFDAVFFSFANLIAPPIRGKEESQKQQFSRLSEIVRCINIPLFVFGVGMQERLTVKEQILPELVDFLTEINSKAEIFGCRGAETQAYLRAIGCDNARAFGCPSLYVYPSQILSIRNIDNFSEKVGITAGYLDRRHLLGYQPERTLCLAKISSNLNLSYVFQNDLLTMWEMEDIQKIYCDADSSCNSKIINAYIESFGHKVQINDYRFFRDPRSWRQFASAQDYFFGDRFHGGVVSLQTGRPALFIQNDVRVKELTDHFSMPCISVNDVINGEINHIVSEAFSKNSIERMQDGYNERLKEYFEATERVNLSPLKGLYVRKEVSKHDYEEIQSAVSLYIEDSAGGQRIGAALDLAVAGSWSLASSERLVNEIAQEKAFQLVKRLISFILKDNNLGEVDEALFFRLSQTLTKSGAHETCVILLQFYLSEEGANWTERILKALINSLLQVESVSMAKEYFGLAKERGCLSWNVAQQLGQLVGE